MIEMHLGGLGFDPKNMSPIVLLRTQKSVTFYPFGLGCLKQRQLQWSFRTLSRPAQ